jgi:dienelactone hydrolase
MHEEIISYSSEGVSCRGYLAKEDSDSSKPAIIVTPAFRGLDPFAREKARELAKLGYAAFAADLYGNGLNVDNNEEASKLMMPLFIDRRTLRNRIYAAYETVKTIPGIDASKIGAIGFCFGGLAAIELLRSGAELKGVVSFHALLGGTLGQTKANLEPPSSKIYGSLLILHGYLDPLVSQKDISDIQQEFTKADIDWSMYIYGRAKHAFMNPLANDDKSGLVYNENISKRAWQSMRDFFDEVLR